ncbi:hypothetical protein OJ996_23485 [Luteolibacter sp. GHJ8]|uniref:Uncharacterized protein n=1 Tax=Luteolibacter rhizosphaerae TaxID=2989719 RepID=A0ABT3G9Q4_9BACT|nr:hypothetical protein [Luteolibacter rhizosphaerae]MCW1916570.1 hypothetical protein [Luteolibacter rhizosphaerae]
MKADLIAQLTKALSEVETALSRHSAPWSDLSERCSSWREVIGSSDAVMLEQAAKEIRIKFHPKSELPLDYELQEEVEALALGLESEQLCQSYAAVIQRVGRKRAQREWEAAISDPEALFPRGLE